MFGTRTNTVASWVIAVAAISMCAVAQAADISMSADDTIGQSSFNSGLHWTGGAAPAAGNNYLNLNYLLRTPADGNSYVFGGDSLTITSDVAIPDTPNNDALMFKGTASATITVNNLTINGGSLRHANNESQTFTLAGTGLTVGANGMGVHVQGPMNITAPVLGSGPIKIMRSGSENAARTLEFDSASSTYNGSIELISATQSRFRLANAAVMNFTIGASGVNNQIFARTGTGGVVTLNGTFKFDLTGAGTTVGDTWQIVDVAGLTETFDASTFTVDGFTKLSATTWVKTAANGARYQFDQATGALTVVTDNFAPAVNAGPDQTVLRTAGSASLSGTVTDDGQPNPPAVTVSRWTIDSQPAGSTLNFADNTQPATTVTFDAGGVYVLRLTACDSGTPGSCLGLETFDTMTLTVQADSIWDGGGAADSWSDNANWDSDLAPVFTGGSTILFFTGSTRLGPANDIVGADLQSIQFDAAAGAFTLTGNALTVRSDVTNDSANAQTVNLAGIALGAGGPGQVTFAAAADMTVSGVLSGNGGLTKSGAGALSIPNANTYAGLTSVNAGTVNISTGTGLGLAATDFASMSFVDAVGGEGGNTVRNSDGDTGGAWMTSTTNISDNLWLSWSNTTAEVTTTFLESGPEAENTDLLRTTVAGLTPGLEYTVGVVYWSSPTEDWTVRAGLASDQLAVFNRSGSNAVVGSYTGASIVFSWGSAIQLLGIVGTATADGSGQIVVYVDDLPTAGGSTRCWYDGLAYVTHGTVSEGAGTVVAGGTSTAVVQLTGGINSAEQFTLSGRSPAAAHIRNVSGNNALTGEIALVQGGDQYLIESAADLVTVQDIINNTANSTARFVHLSGAGAGVVNGVIRNGAATGSMNVVKEGTGTWTLTNDNSDLDGITVSTGTLALSSSLTNNVPDATITVAAGAVLDVTGLSGGGIVLSSANAQTLGGSGLVNGKVIVDAGTTISPGVTATPGTLTINNGLTFNDGSTLKVRLGSPGDVVLVTGGTLTGAGTGGVSVAVDPDGVLPGTYTLMDWSGATASGVDVADFVVTGMWGACLGDALQIVGSTLVINYAGQTATGLMDDLQSYAVGRVDALVNAPWRVISLAGSSFVTIGEDTGNRYLAFSTWSGAGTEGRGGYRSLGCYRVPDGQTRTLFFRWFVPTGGTSLNHYIGLGDTTYAPTSTSANDVADMRVRMHLTPGTTSGTVKFNYANGTTDTVGRDDLAAGTWYNVWVVVRNNTDPAGDVCDYYINTGLSPAVPATDQVAVNAPFRASIATDLMYFSADAWLNSAATAVRIDDIYILDGEVLDHPMLEFGGFDFNDDRFVNETDTGIFISCATGPDIPGPPAECSAVNFDRADADNDGDVDTDDFGRFQRCYAGTAAPDSNCASQ